MVSDIVVKGAKEHNLKNVDVSVTKGKLVAVTGVSGSGKSSLVFDTIYAESFRRFSDASHIPVQLMGLKNQAQGSRRQRPQVSSLTGLPPALGLSQRQAVVGKLSTVGTLSSLTDLLRVFFAAFGSHMCPECNIPMSAVTFSEACQDAEREFLNHSILVVAPVAHRRKGAFEKEMEKYRKRGYSRVRLNGIVERLDGDPEKLRLDPRKLNTVDLILDGFKLTQSKFERLEEALSQAFDVTGGIARLEMKSAKNQGDERTYNLTSGCPQCGKSSEKYDPRHFSHSSLGRCLVCEGTGTLSENRPEDLEPCSACQGSRLQKRKVDVVVLGKQLETLLQWNLWKLREFVLELSEAYPGQKAQMKVISEMKRILDSALELGLGHLTLNRSARQLAPGDVQRLRLASLISNRLRGALYVLDEPCQGLTEQEVQGLVKTLQSLIHYGTSVLVVEHHPLFLKHCDEVVVMGPGAGEHGGQIIQRCNGVEYDPLEETRLFEKHLVDFGHAWEATEKRRRVREFPGADELKSDSKAAVVWKDIQIRGLPQKTVRVVQGQIHLIRGPSGSGKMSLTEHVLLPVLDSLSQGKPVVCPFAKVTCSGEVNVKQVVDVRPGTVLRSTKRVVAAALDILVPLRERFAQTTMSQILGLGPSSYSWHSKAGQCENCQGRGFVEYVQKYAQPIRVECDVCEGRRLSAQSQRARYLGHSFSEVLDLNLRQALTLFSSDRTLAPRLERAVEFGLGDVRLSQTLDSLSGGEVQRLSLTTHLKRVKLQGTFFLLFHPSTGLHLPDINLLGKLLQLMSLRGATFVIVDNREEFSEFSHVTLDF